MKFTLISFTSLLFLACWVTPLRADTEWYDVEVVIFANKAMTGANDEEWPDEPGYPDTTNAVQLVMVTDESLPGMPPIEFQMLPQELWQLSGIEDSLKQSSQYRVITHLAWRQLGLPPDSAPPVLINEGQDSPSLVFNSFDNQPDKELQGLIKISRKRYLHIDADLVYRAQVTADDGSARMASFRLTEHRRMRSKELHYLDHPLFGMIIAITPYKWTPPTPEPPQPVVPKTQPTTTNPAPAG
ncbi:MAG: CsiV family protein [Gammaproteobacteria bacterium]|nr:MAG: CsiV family protein [Gammaproteobacteria bacterium]